MRENGGDAAPEVINGRADFRLSGGGSGFPEVASRVRAISSDYGKTKRREAAGLVMTFSRYSATFFLETVWALAMASARKSS